MEEAEEKEEEEEEEEEEQSTAMASVPSTWASDTSKTMASLALRASTICSYRKTDMAAQLLFSPFASHLYDLAALFHLIHLQSPPFRPNWRVYAAAIDTLLLHDAQLQILDPYSGRCSLYLLLCFPHLLLHFRSFYANLSSSIQSFSALLDCSDQLKSRLSDAIAALHKSADFKLSAREQSLHVLLEQNVLSSSVDADLQLATELAKQVAESLGFHSLRSDGFAEEIRKLKVENASSEAHLQQFVALLDKAMAGVDAAGGYDPAPAPTASASATPAAVGRDTFIQPLQSFICPITQEVMQDPVQIASGQTYEREAIERWFADGHTRCPTGGFDLANTNMKSNIALKQSIEEWKERNNDIRLDAAREHLRLVATPPPPPESTALLRRTKALREIKALCREDSIYKYRTASKGLVSLVVQLAAESTDVELRRNALSVLSVLADNEECQEIMVKEKLIEVIVRYLAQRETDDDVPTGVALMRSLSANPSIAERISHTPSAVLFVVTLINDPRCADDVKQILANLPKTDANAIVMAEANIISPLIERLIQGDGDSKVKMATTLGRLQHLPDWSKTATATSEAMATLAEMLDSSTRQEIEAAVSAMENLSTVEAGRRGIRESNASGRLLRVIKEVHHSESAKEASAAILANLWSSEEMEESEEGLESEAISCFLHLLKVEPATSVGIQLRLLQGLSVLASRRRSSSERCRNLMKELDIFACLIRLFLRLRRSDKPKSVGGGGDKSSRSPLLCHCLDLFACLGTHYRNEAAAAVLAEAGTVPELAKMLRQGKDEPELLSVMSVLACLPSKDAEITKQLVEEEEEQVVRVLVGQIKEQRSEAMAAAAAGALLRLTREEDMEMQAKLGKAGAVAAYVELLKGGGNEEGRRIAAMAMANFSRSTAKLTEKGGRRAKKKKKKKWLQRFIICTAAVAGEKRSKWRNRAVCDVHGGRCSVEETFCLVSAKAVAPLIDSLSSDRCRLAALDAIATLLFSSSSDNDNDDDDDDAAAAAIAAAESCDGACSVIDRIPGAFRRIISLIGSPPSSLSSLEEHIDVQKLVLCICQKLFSVPRFRASYASYAQLRIITVVQGGEPLLRHLAAGLLRDLQLLQSSQSYFSSTTGGGVEAAAAAAAFLG